MGDFLGGRREEALLEDVVELLTAQGQRQHEQFEQQRETNRLLRELVRQQRLPSTITFQEITMLPATGGNTLVYTGTLAPAGSQLPPDTQVSLSSSDPTVQPTVDSTNLVVTVPLPTGFVDDPANPFTVGYSASSAANPNWSLSATITPSAPVALPTSIVFNQTT